MRINYYLGSILRRVEVDQPCPGCGTVDRLAVHSRMVSYTNDKTIYYIGCGCGWLGPAAEDATKAAQAWDFRIQEPIFERS